MKYFITQLIQTKGVKIRDRRVSEAQLNKKEIEIFKLFTLSFREFLKTNKIQYVEVISDDLN